MTKNEYKHFNPKKYNLDVKIATVRTGSHCKFNINYHIIWIPKYRRKVLTGKVTEVIKTIIQGQCEDLDLDMLALEVMPDHIHLFVGAKPKHTPWKIVKQLKGKRIIRIHKILLFIKVWSYHFFAFVGFWFLFWWFMLGHPYLNDFCNSFIN